MVQSINPALLYSKFVVYAMLIATISILPSSGIAQKRKNTMPGQNSNAGSTKGIAIHQEIDFEAAPQRVYETLLSSKKFSDCTKLSFGNFSAMSATIDSAVGGTFSVFDGHIIGRILELIPGKRIVEAWRVVDWPDGVYSIAKFEFKPLGNGTKLLFDHTGFPDGLKEHLSIGWTQHYWEALKKYLQ